MQELKMQKVAATQKKEIKTTTDQTSPISTVEGIQLFRQIIIFSGRLDFSSDEFWKEITKLAVCIYVRTTFRLKIEPELMTM